MSEENEENEGKAGDLGADIVVIDLETSGLDPLRHGILDIGAVALHWPELRVVGEYACEVTLTPGVEYDIEAMQIHHVTEESARYDSERATLLVGLVGLVEWLHEVGCGRKMIFAGSNPGFDRAFLDIAMNKCSERGYLQNGEWESLLTRRLWDLQSIALDHAWLMGCAADEIRQMNTDAIYRLLGMGAEPLPHTAIQGARMEAEAFRRIVTGWTPKFDAAPGVRGGVPYA